jgi:hypothetical protein
MTVTGLDVVELCDDFETSASHIELRPWQWLFLHAIDGRMEVRNVAAACGVEVPTAIAFVEEVHASGLLRVVSISLADYRTSKGSTPMAFAPVETAPVESASGSVVTAGDHFSSTDVLPAYERPIPAWMMEPQPPVEYEHEPVIEHEEAPAASEEPAVLAAHADDCSPQEEHVVAEDHAVAGDSAVTEQYAAYEEHAAAEDHPAHDEHAVAEEHGLTEAYGASEGHTAPEVHGFSEENAVAEDQAVAEAHAGYEPAVSSGHGEFADLLAGPVAHDEAPMPEALPDEAALAFMHEDATASQVVADLVARHHETSYSEHEYFTASTAPAEEEAAPEHEPHYASEHADYTSAHTPEDFAAEVPSEYAAHAPDYTENYAEPVAHVEPEPEVAHSNGRSTAWEPLSLVAHVDEETAPLEHDSFRDPSMPEGVSIWLSHGSSSGVYEPELEEKGSVSFSLSPEDAPDMHPIATDSPSSAPREHVEPVAASAEIAPKPIYQAPSQDVAGVYSAAQEPTNGHIDNLPAAQPSGGTTTADIVGSLISRALTFRIK